MLDKLNDKVKKGLDKYLEFDTDIIWKNTDYCEVYGGATRDIISNNKINDIDFMVLSNSQQKLMKILEINGYVKMDNLTSKNIHEMYKDIKCIFEPITYLKGLKVVQLIRPSSYSKINGSLNKGVFYTMSNRFFELIREVDMSCSGVSFNGLLRENCEDAILHCLSKVYKINENAELLNPERLYERKEKIINKGFEEYSSMDKNKQLFQKYSKLLGRSDKLFSIS